MQIEVIAGPDRGQSATVREVPVGIGRHPDNTLVLSDSRVSGRHASIEPGPDGAFVLRDLGSSNGTYIDGIRVHGQGRLVGHEQITIGQDVLQLTPSRESPTVIVSRNRLDSPAVPPRLAQDQSPRYVEPPRIEGGTGHDRGRKSLWILIAAGACALVAVGALVAVLLTTRHHKAATTQVAARTSRAPAHLNEEQIVAKARKFVVEISGQEGNEIVGGTGIVIDAQRGLILTNAHVITGLSSLNVRFDNGQSSTARVLGQAPCDDIAVIAVNDPPSTGVTPAVLSTSPLADGQHVTSLGYPASFANPNAQRVVSTDGEVSSPDISAAPDPGLPHYASVVQHTATINPGNSGGPLVDDDGRVVGMNTLGNTEQGGRIIQGQYYAITTKQIEQDLPSLEQGKSKSYVGWRLVPLSEVNLAEFFAATGFSTRSIGHQVSTYFRQNRINGLIVEGSDPGSVAAQDGYSQGDLIRSIDGTPVSTVGGVCNIVDSHGPGDTLLVDGTYVTSSQKRFLDNWEQNTRLR